MSSSMKIPDGRGGYIDLVTHSDGTVTAGYANQGDAATSHISRGFEVASITYKNQEKELLRFQKQSIKDIKKRYENSAFGIVRAAWAARRFEKEVLHPLQRDLQTEQARRIQAVGNLTFDTAMQAAQLQADHTLKQMELLNKIELQPYEREIAFFDAETDIAIKRQYAELANEAAEAELSRELRRMEAEFRNSERLEQIRADGATRLEQVRQDGAARVENIRGRTDIKVTRIKTTRERQSELEAREAEREREDRADKRTREERSYQIVRDARNMAKQIPQFEAAVNLLKAEGPEEIAAAAARVYSAFLADNSLLRNAPYDQQPAVADRMLDNASLLLNHYLTGKFKPKDQ